MNLKMIVAVVAGVVLISTIVGTNGMASGSISISETESKQLVCLDCHRSPNINTNEGVLNSQAFCYACHQNEDCVRSSEAEEAAVTLQVTPAIFNVNQQHHRVVACIQCHADVARSPHKTMEGATCRSCHSVHGESEAHSPHLRVSCQACHFKSPYVALNSQTDVVSLSHSDLDMRPVSLADHALADINDPETCVKCHQPDNRVGAPAAVLPSKSVLCIVCHNSPLDMGHPIFGVAIIVFFIGIVLTLRFWYMGSVQGEENSLHRKISLSSESIWKTIFSRQLFSIVKIIILDVIFQRRILKESIGRWSMHSLIFSAILLRLGLSLFTAVTFFFSPDGDMALALVDKNHPFTAFVNDLLGLFILLGILWAAMRRYFFKPAHVTTEYQDNIALAGIGALVVIGFILEGARITLTGIPDGIAMAAFVGYPLSKVFSLLDVDWTGIYPILWYVHGVIAALFIAYLPFGKMRHVFNTPLTYVLEDVSGVKNEKRV